MTPRTFIDVHVLQTVPPSNLNRDDAGTPKQATYGGVRRARVSSQAWKRATRMTFRDTVPHEDRATRTKKISSLIADRLQAAGDLDAEQAMRLSTHLLKPLKITPGRKESETSYLLFLGHRQLDRIADLVGDRIGELAALDDDALSEAVKDVGVSKELVTGHPLDVALFGRMVADLATLNVDAACQVAHAISTHPVDVEFDYFTAVDDENPKEDTGAGMIGTVEFNSATLYRYATVGFPQLLENLGGDIDAATSALDAFIDGFARSIPSGHQNSFAHRTLPSLVLVTVRDDQPVNLVSAFEKPVPVGAGVSAESATALAKELTETTERWARPPVSIMANYAASSDRENKLQEAFGPSVAFPDLRSQVLDAVRGVWAPVTA